MLGGIESGREGDDRGWDGWMASPTQWTWVWVNSGSWWWTGSPGVLRFIGLQRVWHDWATELNWVVKNLPDSAGDMGLIPGLRRSPGEGNGNPLQYSFLGNAMDRGAWLATVHKVTESWTRLERLSRKHIFCQLRLTTLYLCRDWASSLKITSLLISWRKKPDFFQSFGKLWAPSD